MEDLELVISKEKSNLRFFRFLFFEIWLITFTIYGDTPGVPPTKKKSCSKVVKFTGKMRIALTMIFKLLSFILCDFYTISWWISHKLNLNSHEWILISQFWNSISCAWIFFHIFKMGFLLMHAIKFPAYTNRFPTFVFEFHDYVNHFPT